MTDANYKAYKSARNNVKTELRKAKYSFEKDLASKIKTDNKLFLSYIRSKMKTRSGLGELEMPNGSLTSDNQETANIQNSFFASVFENKDAGDLPEFQDRQFAEHLCSTNITTDRISKAIDKINASKSIVPDNIHPKLIKECKKSMLLLLKIIFTKSLEEGKIPHIWTYLSFT